MLRVRLTEDDNGADVRTNADGAVEVGVYSNPSTGYQWSIEMPPNCTVAERHYEPTFRPDSPAAPVGSGGVECFTLKAEQPGWYRVVMRYEQPWNPGYLTTTIAFTLDASEE